MIIRCRRPRKKQPDRLCGGLVGAAPDGALVVGRVARIAEADPHNHVAVCSDCGAMWEVRPPRSLTGAA